MGLNIKSLTLQLNYFLHQPKEQYFLNINLDIVITVPHYKYYTFLLATLAASKFTVIIYCSFFYNDKKTPSKTVSVNDLD